MRANRPVRWVCLLAAPCVVACANTPSAVAGGPDAYRDALRRGDLDAAYAMTSPGFRAETPPEVFRERLASPDARATKADALDASLSAVARAAPELGIVAHAPKEGPAEVLRRFVGAAEKGDFRAAYALLGSKWRLRYSPERLAADFAREPLARERLARARVALESPPAVDGDDVRFAIGEGRAVVLHRETEGYRVTSLE